MKSYQWDENVKIGSAWVIQESSGLNLQNPNIFWDQIRGTEPRYCTTKLIHIVWPSTTSSDIICSVSTSLATLPLLCRPHFKYLHQKIEK